MQIFVKAKPGARVTNVKKIDDQYFVVSVTALPEKGRANQAVRQALADYFGVGVRFVTILRGHTSALKTVIIELPIPNSK